MTARSQRNTTGDGASEVEVSLPHTNTIAAKTETPLITVY